MRTVRSFWTRPAIRFLICGGFAAFVNWAVRFPLSLVMPFPAAVMVALVIGMAVGFVLYRTVVWPRSGRPLTAEVGTFIAVNSVNAIGILVVSTALVSAIGLLRLNQYLGEGFAHAMGIAAGAVANFVGHSRFTFTARKTAVKPYA